MSPSVSGLGIQDSQSKPTGQEPRVREKVDVPAHAAHRGHQCPFLLLFSLSVPSPGWGRPTHSGREICFTESLHSNANGIQKQPRRHTQSHI